MHPFMDTRGDKKGHSQGECRQQLQPRVLVLLVSVVAVLLQLPVLPEATTAFVAPSTPRPTVPTATNRSVTAVITIHSAVCQQNYDPMGAIGNDGEEAGPFHLHGISLMCQMQSVSNEWLSSLFKTDDDGHTLASYGAIKTTHLHVVAGDTSNGTKEAPAPDDPLPLVHTFTSVHAAQVALRSGLGAGSRRVVSLHAGTHHLPRPLNFDARDSGQPDSPIIWRSLPRAAGRGGGRAWLTGGVQVPASAFVPTTVPSGVQGVLKAELFALGFNASTLGR